MCMSVCDLRSLFCSSVHHVWNTISIRMFSKITVKRSILQTTSKSSIQTKPVG